MRVLQSGDRPQLRASVEKAINEVVAAQERSGYLNTYYVDDRKSLRMLPETQTTGHELYNIGHMLQGAIAYYRATEPQASRICIRFGDHFCFPAFGHSPEEQSSPATWVSWGRLSFTGSPIIAYLAGYILQGDKRIELPEHRTIYMFSGTPCETKLESHSSRHIACAFFFFGDRGRFLLEDAE